MTSGTIVLTPFPFSNLQGTKVRPALVVSSVKRKGNDVIVAFISSVVDSKLIETDYLFQKNNSFFPLSGLKGDSVFKMDKLVTLDKSILIGELGSVPASLMKTLDSKLKIALEL